MGVHKLGATVIKTKDFGGVSHGVDELEKARYRLLNSLILLAGTPPLGILPGPAGHGKGQRCPVRQSFVLRRGLEREVMQRR